MGGTEDRSIEEREILCLLLSQRADTYSVRAQGMNNFHSGIENIKGSASIEED